MHLGAVREAGEAAGDDLPARLQSPRHDRDVLVLLPGRHVPQRRHVVLAEHVDVSAVGAALDRRARHDDGLFDRVDDKPHIHELPRPQPQRRIGEGRLDPRGAGRLVDLVVDHRNIARLDHGGVVGAERADMRGAFRHRVARGGQRLLRDREDDVDRLQLRDDQNADLIRGVQNIADVDQPYAGAAVDRRVDRAIVERGFGAVDRGLIGPHLRLQLRHQIFLRVILLLRTVMADGQLLVAHEIESRIGEGGLVLRLFRDGLIILGLIEIGLDQRHDVALLHVLAFVEGELDEAAVDLRVDRRRVERLHGSHRVDGHGHVRQPRGRGGHGNRRSRRFGPRRRRRGLARDSPAPRGGERQNEHDGEPQENQASV